MTNPIVAYAIADQKGMVMVGSIYTDRWQAEAIRDLLLTFPDRHPIVKVEIRVIEEE